ncbi:hypothetical protein FRC14_006591 [Serendipita sp. 396]|nr:hypothetical protein FRC14_006591 [Serendipita sp. 396]KAG8864664.1 hypothetical protein FRC20_010178 [Serendipita sp. 405]
MTARYLRLGPLANFLTYTRFSATLRAGKQTYHSLLIFRLSGGTLANNSQSTLGFKQTQVIRDGKEMQIYAMEAQCPHLGADLSHAEIEECDDEVVAVCPWHRYDFNLKTGISETGLRACVYEVQLRTEEDSTEEDVWIETPPSAESWEVVSIRPVSEAFVEIPNDEATINADGISITTPSDINIEPVVPGNPPSTLLEWAALILNTPNAELKVHRTRHAVGLFQTGQMKSIGRRKDAPSPPVVPPREKGMVLVDPTKVAKRGKGGSLKSRITMLHALANIEQWAIDLAWDIIVRFGNDRSLPHQFYTDFARMALDEAKHFTLLSNRLRQLGTSYGSLPIHSSLWESALKTSDSFLARLAIIHLVHEARGLDVNPVTISKFEKAGDTESVASLQIIHLDEITHVTSGHRWFTWKCGEEGIDPVQTFRSLVRERFQGQLRGPFNIDDRKKAGMGKEFYEDLVGGSEVEEATGAAAPGLTIAYES